MPAYEYICIECKNKFDSRLTFAEKESGFKPDCPKCNSRKTVQFFGSFTVNSDSKNNADYGSMSGCDPNAGTGCCQ